MLVGIGRGVPSLPSNDIRLGNVVVSSAIDHSGVVQYDRGQKVQGNRFERTGSLNRPPEVVRQAVSYLRATHSLERGKLAEFVCLGNAVKTQGVCLARWKARHLV